MDNSWCTIESDPGVFSTMLRELGVKGIQIEELWGLDKDAVLSLNSPLKAIIFLFKYDPVIVKKTHENSKISNDSKIYFAKQIINNACATQALINAVMNFSDTEQAESNQFSLGNLLTSFKTFTNDFPSDAKGETLSNSEDIRKTHNSFAKQTVFEIDHSMIRSQKEDPFHFVTYMPYNGKLIELDGLMPGPIEHGNLDQDSDWFLAAQRVLEQRMALYGETEIRFNLMAIVGDKKQIAEEKLAKETEKENFSAEVIENLQNEIEIEDLKFENYAKENILRRHNFLPMIIEHMKVLAKDGKLVETLEQNKMKLKQKA